MSKTQTQNTSCFADPLEERVLGALRLGEFSVAELAQMLSAHQQTIDRVMRRLSHARKVLAFPAEEWCGNPACLYYLPT